MATPFQREKDGMRMQFRGINTVNPPDKMPPGKFPFAANIRAYLRDQIIARSTQDVPVEDLMTGLPVHSLRRLNDSTPSGPVPGFILVAGSGVELFANQVVVDSGLSGNPISLIPFRPNASVQPWMYVGDSLKMDKVRSDGTCYLMGIEEPQAAPTTVSTPASNIVSTVGPVTVTYWGDSPHSGPTGNYIWKNASDLGGSGPIRSSAAPAGVTTGNSLLFDVTPGSPSVAMAWTQYAVLNGTVNTAGTAVSWVSGDQFGSITAGQSILIGTNSYVVNHVTSNTALVLNSSAGTQTGATYQAAALSGTVPVFQPALESEGYADFNFALETVLYVPAAGTYVFTVASKDEFLWGIGGTATGTASWPGPTGGQQLASSGQTKTALNGYPLIPKTITLDGGGQTDSASVSITFSTAGNYPLEIDYDYWYHSNRTLTVKCNGINIPPLENAVITESQYRYVYRSSVTGAVSNPSPSSPEQSQSVLANFVTPTASTDPQVDKIDFYRLDQGSTAFTYVGTTTNASASTVTVQAVTVTGSPVEIGVQSIVTMSPGQVLSIDTGVNQENVILISVVGGLPLFHIPPGITAVFTKTHSVGVPVVATGVTFFDELLDADIVANPVLEFDNFQPFPVIDAPRAGLLTVSGGVATWVAGDLFNTRWLGGTIIIIGTVAYTLYNRPSSPTKLVANNTEIIGGIQTTVPVPDGINLPFEISEPLLAAQPLPYMWGPTDNVSFFFACGDTINPGKLYWSKGNNPDSAPDTNQQDVTSPSEPLINGCIVNGIGLVMSSERGFLIYPNFFNALATVTGTEGSTWTIQESISTRGLYMPRCICVDGGGNVFFRAKDGIMMSRGGQGATSITDGDLYNLFPHEGIIPQAVTLGGFTIIPPDDTLPQQQTMNVANGFLYYDYYGDVGLGTAPQTLVYDIANQAWVVDNYQFPATLHILEEGPNVNGVLLGCQDGTVRPLTDSGAESGTRAVLLTPCVNAGDARAPKNWGDIYVEAEPE